MHRSVFEIKDYGKVVVHHNGDWSGEAIVEWMVIDHGGDPTMVPPMREVRLPAALLVQLGAPVAHAALSSDLITWLEQHEPTLTAKPLETPDEGKGQPR